MASEVEYANEALTQLGDKRLTSLTDDNETARKVNAIFGLKRDELLSMHKWNFATKRRNLAQKESSPLFDYDNLFALPSDLLRLCMINDQDIERVDHRIEENGLLTDEGTAKIVYIYRVTNTGAWPAFFGMAFSAYLAAELAYPITQSHTLATNLFTTFQLKYRTATSIDAQSGGEARPIRQNDILRVRGKTHFDGLDTGTH